MPSSTSVLTKRATNEPIHAGMICRPSRTLDGRFLAATEMPTSLRRKAAAPSQSTCHSPTVAMTTKLRPDNNRRAPTVSPDFRIQYMGMIRAGGEPRTLPGGPHRAPTHALKCSRPLKPNRKVWPNLRNQAAAPRLVRNDDRGGCVGRPLGVRLPTHCRSHS
jgi:hypothetical protein